MDIEIRDVAVAQHAQRYAMLDIRDRGVIDGITTDMLEESRPRYSQARGTTQVRLKLVE